MRILIVYASYNNTTQMCAKLLAEKLPNSDIVNLAKSKADLSNYDTVIIGSCIRFNVIHNSVKNFIGDNLDTLLNMNTGIYLCCGFPEKANQYLLHNFPKKLLENSTSIQCFGGNLKVKPYRLHDQLIVNIVKKNFKNDKRTPTEISNESILKMVEDINNIK
ncbi:MAG: flavodoxin domain-containing protein [Sedimentibacter sp.]